MAFKGKTIILYYIMEEQQLSKKEKKALYLKDYLIHYRKEHKEAIIEQRKTYMQNKIVCSCGVEVIRNNFTRHLNTKKHSKALEQKKSRRIATI